MKLHTLGRKISKNRRNIVLVMIGIVLGVGGVYMTQAIRTTKPLAYQSGGITAKWLPDSVKKWEKQIDTQAQRYNVDPNFIGIIMTLESGGYPKADSGQAKGLMQITPATAKDIAAKFLREPLSKFDIWDPETNIEFGAAYINYLRNEFNMGTTPAEVAYTAELVAAGYNGGPGAANNVYLGKGLLDTQTVVYSRDAFNMWREQNAQTSPTYSRWLERGGEKLVRAAQ